MEKGMHMDHLVAAANVADLLIDKRALDAAQPGHRREMIERALSDALDMVDKVVSDRLARARQAATSM